MDDPDDIASKGMWLPLLLSGVTWSIIGVLYVIVRHYHG